MQPSTRLTSRFASAVTYAIDAHGDQCRKGTSVTYLSHLLGVASLVLEYGGSEDAAIGGLLHDAVEDCGSAHQAAIHARFGEGVARIVADCTDGTQEAKSSLDTVEGRRADWEQRKRTYLEHLHHVGSDSLLVSCCDKLHNARAIVADVRALGPVVFERFKAGRQGTLWYYGELAKFFAEHGAPPATELGVVVAQMRG